MDNVLVALKFESLQNLDGKSTNQTGRHSLKIVLLYEFVKIHGQ